MSSHKGLFYVVKLDTDFDTAGAIQKVLEEQERDDAVDEASTHPTVSTPSSNPNPSRPSHIYNESSEALQSFTDDLTTANWFTSSSPLTSPEATPPTTPTQQASGLPTTENAPDWYTMSSPLTSPDHTPPSSPLQTRKRLPKIRLHPALLLPLKKAKVSPEEPAKKSSISALRRQKRNKSARACRTSNREAERAAGNVPHRSREKTQEKYVQGASAVETNYTFGQARITKPGYIGTPLPKQNLDAEYTLKDLIGPPSKFQFTLQEWDGSFSMGILDAQNRVIGVLAGHPDDKTWATMQIDAEQALESLRPEVHLSRHECENTPRCGDFVALDTGVSFGGGQKKPSNLRNHPTNQRILEKLLKMEAFQRIAGFASSVLATWAPDLHEHYIETLDDLLRRDPTLKQPFPSTAFAGVSFNSGPKTTCHEHTDNTNTAYGMCAVTPLGEFDYTKGGHLVLWDLHLVIEFPPGCTILLPSAIIAHSNVMIGENETCYSFVQYTAGGLFRWVDQGYQTKKEYLDSLLPWQLLEEEERRIERGRKGLAMFLTVDTA